MLQPPAWHASPGAVHPLDAIFHPRSIAVVGASADPRNAGNRFLRVLQDFAFPGPLYAVHPGAASVLGLPTYPRVRDLPERVDHVISAVPWHATPDLVQDCIARGVRSLHLYTARLAETGLPERRALEAEMVGAARAAGLRLIGPNCMGIYCPAASVGFRFGLPREPGAVAYFSQSGGNSVNLVQKGAGRGLRFSKIVSYGNAADLNEADFLEYFLWDPQTTVIAAYIEGVKDGRRFLAALQGAHKPVVVLKGGRTAAGSRAVHSHTASLAGDDALWDALERQTALVRVDSMEELADVVLAFCLLPPLRGRRVALMGGGGGESVSGADACERHGLVVPALPPSLQEQFRERFPEVGMLLSNPLDGSVTGGGKVFLEAALDIARWDDIDLLVGNAGIEWALDDPRDNPAPASAIAGYLRVAQEVGKPLAVVVGWLDTLESWKWDAVRACQQACLEAGLPVFPSTQRAASAIKKVVSYYERMDRTD
ncbi:MAG: CoA-binding protein [Chloroflexi bacterium]|nr:CoA-binding protein [Chloroflexota bacterium]